MPSAQLEGCTAHCTMPSLKRGTTQCLCSKEALLHNASARKRHSLKQRNAIATLLFRSKVYHLHHRMLCWFKRLLIIMSFRKLYCSISRRVTGINNIQQSTLIGKKTFSTHCSSSHIDEERGSLLWQFYRLMFRLWWICHTPGFCIFLPEQDLPVLANTDCTLHVVLRFVVCCGLVHS